MTHWKAQIHFKKKKYLSCCPWVITSPFPQTQPNMFFFYLSFLPCTFSFTQVKSHKSVSYLLENLNGELMRSLWWCYIILLPLLLQWHTSSWMTHMFNSLLLDSQYCPWTATQNIANCRVDGSVWIYARALFFWRFILCIIGGCVRSWSEGGLWTWTWIQFYLLSSGPRFTHWQCTNGLEWLLKHYGAMLHLTDNQSK